MNPKEQKALLVKITTAGLVCWAMFLLGQQFC